MFTNQERLAPELANCRSMDHVASSSLLNFLVANTSVESLARDSKSDEQIGSLLHPQALFVAATLAMILIGIFQFG